MPGNPKQDTINSEETVETEEKQYVKIGTTKLKSSASPFEFKGFQERFQQVKAAQREEMKDEMAGKEMSTSSVVDQEDVLAKRTIEEIPGLVKEEGEDKVAPEDLENEKLLTRPSGVETENQTHPVFQYSDKGTVNTV